ncbi:MAG: hypothetical protein ABIN80_21990 [Dyadobacter sp.]|uniref:hypothetical protein n=1 Tax=Dyadobacter sp. TaxID=1914288 RepID=UPI003265B5F2
MKAYVLCVKENAFMKVLGVEITDFGEWLIVATVAAVVVIYIFKKWQSGKCAASRSGAREVLAEGIVISTGPADAALEDESRVKLYIHVKPKQGRNFISELNFDVSTTQDPPVTGTKVLVKFNPANRNHLILMLDHQER